MGSRVELFAEIRRDARSPLRGVSRRQQIGINDVGHDLAMQLAKEDEVRIDSNPISPNLVHGLQRPGLAVHVAQLCDDEVAPTDVALVGEEQAAAQGVRLSPLLSWRRPRRRSSWSAT